MLSINIHEAKAKLSECLAAVEAGETVQIPPIPHDPFDRMLICQAIANQMIIPTPDRLITQYPVFTCC